MKQALAICHCLCFSDGHIAVCVGGLLVDGVLRAKCRWTNESQFVCCVTTGVALGTSSGLAVYVILYRGWKMDGKMKMFRHLCNKCMW